VSDGVPRCVQSAVANCTVVTAIAMCASHERRFGSPLLSSIVYPRDASGRATYNPRGKYCVRLYINGCWRCAAVCCELCCCVLCVVCCVLCVVVLLCVVWSAVSM
jgi:hypothetical protein